MYSEIPHLALSPGSSSSPEHAPKCGHRAGKGLCTVLAFVSFAFVSFPFSLSRHLSYLCITLLICSCIDPIDKAFPAVLLSSAVHAHLNIAEVCYCFLGLRRTCSSLVSIT